MIQVTRLSQETYWLNPLLIETIEAMPDTIITLITGKKLLVKEPPEELLLRIRKFYETIPFTTLPSRIFSQSLSEGDLE